MCSGAALLGLFPILVLSARPQNCRRLCIELPANSNLQIHHQKSGRKRMPFEEHGWCMPECTCCCTSSLWDESSCNSRSATVHARAFLCASAVLTSSARFWVSASSCLLSSCGRTVDTIGFQMADNHALSIYIVSSKMIVIQMSYPILG